MSEKQFWKRSDGVIATSKDYDPSADWIAVDANGQPVTAAPTGSAYSIEEHMFRQDEIRKRHPQPPDQQRSEDEITALQSRVTAATELVLSITSSGIHLRDDHDRRECNWCKLEKILRPTTEK